MFKWFFNIFNLFKSDMSSVNNHQNNGIASEQIQGDNIEDMSDVSSWATSSYVEKY